MPGGLRNVRIARSRRQEHDDHLGVGAYKNANTQVTNGRFLAYDGSTLGNSATAPAASSSSGTARTGISSTSSTSFNVPIVWSGRVFLPAYNGSLLVFG